jgi:hypothetical protein
MKKGLVIIFLVLLVMGLQTSCSKKKSAEPKDYNLLRYYLPLDQGNYWVFSHKSKTKTDTISVADSLVSLGGKSCFLVKHRGNYFLSEGIAFALFREGKNIKAMGQKDSDTTSVLAYQLPFVYLIDTLITSGSWERYFYPKADSSFDSIFTASITNNKAKITTGVGIFYDCLEVCVSNQNNATLFKEYYAPGIGWIKFLPLVWAETKDLDTLEILYYYISDIIEP